MRIAQRILVCFLPRFTYILFHLLHLLLLLNVYMLVIVFLTQSPPKNEDTLLHNQSTITKLNTTKQHPHLYPIHWLYSGLQINRTLSLISTTFFSLTQSRTTCCFYFVFSSFSGATADTQHRVKLRRTQRDDLIPECL